MGARGTSPSIPEGTARHVSLPKASRADPAWPSPLPLGQVSSPHSCSLPTQARMQFGPVMRSQSGLPRDPSGSCILAPGPPGNLSCSEHSAFFLHKAAVELPITLRMDRCKAFGKHVNSPVSVASIHFSEYPSTVPTFLSHASHRQGRAAAFNGPHKVLGGLVTALGKCWLLPGHLSKSLVAFGRDPAIDKDLSVTP